MAALDIEGALARVAGPARQLADEASRCLRVGAYRASVVTTWSAIVFDVIEKIEALQALGDPRVASVHARIAAIFSEPSVSKRIQDLGAFETDIASICENTLQIVSDAEARSLERIKEERNFCAHPSFNVDRELYLPSYEQALSHLSSAIRLVLTRQPIEGGPAVERACSLIASLSFPEDVEKAERVLSDQYHFGRASEAAARNVVLKLFKGLVSGAPELDQARRRVRVGLLALSNLRPEAVANTQQNLENFLGRATDEDTLLRFVGLAGVAPIFTRVASDAVIERIKALVDRLDGNSLGELGLVAGLMKFAALKDSTKTRLTALSPGERAQALAASSEPGLSDLVISTLVDSGSWGFTADFVTEVARPYISLFTLRQFEDLLTGARENRKFGGYNQVLGTGEGIAFVQEAIVQCIQRFGADGEAVVAAFKTSLPSSYLDEIFPNDADASDADE
jgi:hypothetical protein